MVAAALTLLRFYHRRLFNSLSHGAILSSYSVRAGAMRAALLCVALVMMAGCAPLDAVPIEPTPLAQKDCTEIATAAVKDAAADQYNAVMQDVVYKNSYDACVQAKLGANFPK
jgi:hypothetical protein